MDSHEASLEMCDGSCLPPYHQETRVALYLGDCVEVMKAMPEASVDAIVTDPPYGLGFMNREWDRFADGLPNAEAWQGRRADTAVTKEGTNTDAPGARFPSGVYSGRNVFKRCRKCKKRAFSGSPCRCPEKDWQYESPGSAPVHLVIFQRWCEEWAREALRVLKPGGHLLAFGGTRTFHRLTCALEDAGFEIRDCLMWLYGSGFPKSLDVSKAIDKAAGTEREVVASRRVQDIRGGNFMRASQGDPATMDYQTTAPATDAARQWSGWGTALKPAWEPIVLARKPLGEANVAANVLKHGTGAVNVDGCRVTGARGDGHWSGDDEFDATSRPGYNGGFTKGGRQAQAGRWPANLVLDEEAARLLNEQSGDLQSGFMKAGTIRNQHESVAMHRMTDNACSRDTFADSGGASRFFYTAKADREDRDGTKHPTVKPVDLCKWLVRLVTPPGGTVLDPFCGSGPIVYAARELGFMAIGCDREREYLDDTVRRLRQQVLPL